MLNTKIFSQGYSHFQVTLGLISVHVFVYT